MTSQSYFVRPLHSKKRPKIVTTAERKFTSAGAEVPIQWERINTIIDININILPQDITLPLDIKISLVMNNLYLE
jgi:hypothetical protein